MNEARLRISMEDLEADFRMLGLSNSEMLRQLAQTNKELLRDTLHEAAHCVAAWRLGFPVHEMDIGEFDAIKRGYKIVKFEIAEFKLKYFPDKTNFNLAVVILAGLAAEGMMFRESYTKTAWKPDIDDAKEYLRQIPGDNDQAAAFKKALDTAKELVQANWSTISRLTIGAYHFGPVLDGAQILELIAGTNEEEERDSIPPAPQRKIPKRRSSSA